MPGNLTCLSSGGCPWTRGSSSPAIPASRTFRPSVDTPATKAFGSVIDAVASRLPVDTGISLNTVNPLKVQAADAVPGGCDPEKCDC